jgi:acetate kinase
MGGRSVLAVNSGSSSIKFALFSLEAEPRTLRRGTLQVQNRETAATRLFDEVGPELKAAPLGGIGHRIVHGGPDHHEPSPITPALLQTLTDLIPFAPNHLPDEIALIAAFGRAQPEVPQFACFDTGFHHDLPAVAQRLPIPQSLANAGVRRYGFHGLSYAFLTRELRRLAGDQAADGRVVLAHLGSGSSLAAVRGGKSLDTSMGLTPLGGVVMSTRSGDIDPGVLIHLQRTTGMDVDQLERLFSGQGGLLGISDQTGDMRELLAREQSDPACRLAVAVYCYEIRKRIGSYAAVLGGLDTLVFAGGIGEHAPAIRARICAGLDFLGLRIDDEANARCAPVISAATAAAVIRVIPTDEEMMIAYAANTLLR